MGIGKVLKNLTGGVSGSSQDLVAAAPASSPGKPTIRQIYQNRYNHGPNIGGMFVLEKWISGDNIYAGAQKGSELDAVDSFASKNGIDAARQKWEDHWNNWLSDDDWNWMKSKGVTAIRVPIGYWTVNNGAYTKHTPFDKYASVYANAWTSFKSKILDKALSYEIAVVVDLHGLPGGANGEEHSGTSSGKADFWDSSDNVDLTLDILRFIASDIKGYDNVCAIQVINEAPYSDHNKPQKHYYLKAIGAIREQNHDVPVAISDGWSCDHFLSFITDSERKLSKSSSHIPQSLGVIIDTHIYKCFSQQDKSRSPEQLIMDVNNCIPFTDSVDIMVGEFSCVMDEQTWGKLQGDKGQTVLRYGQSQISHFIKRAKAGNYFWTYKFSWGSGGEWGFREMTDKGALPNYSDIHGKSAEEYNQEFQRRLLIAKTNHINYWTKEDSQRDWQHWRFEDGFRTGWSDSQAFDEFHHSQIGRVVAWRTSREAEHTHEKGTGDLIWVWRQGFNQGMEQFLQARG
jgi:aryl-phospho-beta-D-glucosidase BglC (GH1 family)